MPYKINHGLRRACRKCYKFLQESSIKQLTF
nr:MAG TPA: hypothetical protein [Caudoviricetes sp.]